MRNGVLHHFRQRTHAHLLHDARLVRTHRLDAQVQVVGDFRDRLARHQQGKDFEFAVRQLFVQQAFIRHHDVEHELLRHFGADVGTPRRHLVDGAHELGARAFLGQIALRAGADGAHRILFFLVHGEDQDGQLGCFAANLPLC